MRVYINCKIFQDIISISISVQKQLYIQLLLPMSNQSHSQPQGHPHQRLADLRRSGLSGDAAHRKQIPGRGERRVAAHQDGDGLLSFFMVEL